MKSRVYPTLLTVVLIAALAAMVLPSRAAVQSSTITGEIRLFAGSTAPSGFLLCDGQAVSRSTFASLYAVVGDTYGAGDGSTNFNVPNFKGRSAIGSGQGAGLTDRALGSSGGEEAHQLSVSEIPAHNHLVNCTAADAVSIDVGGNLLASPGTAIYKNTTPSTTMATSMIANTGGDGSHNTMMPYLTVNYIIAF
jgi:microcystin-dependent protein